MSILDLKLRFKALNDIAKPFKDINKSLKGLNEQAKESQKTLKSLNGLQTLIEQNKSLQDQLNSTTQAQKKQAEITDKLANEYNELYSAYKSARGAMGQSTQTLSRLEAKKHELNKQLVMLMRNQTANKDKIQQVRQAMREHNLTLTEHKQRHSQLRKSLIKTSDARESAKKKLEESQTAEQSLNKEHEKSIGKLDALRLKMKEAGLSTLNLSNQEQRLKANIDSTTASLSKQNKNLDALRDKRKKLAHIEKQRQASRSRWTNTGMAGLSAATAGSAGLYAMRSMLMPSLGFDKTMSSVMAKSGLDKTSKEFKALRDEARKLGADTQFSAIEAAQGMDFLAMTGFKSNQIIAAMPSMLDLAKVGNMELGDASNIASNILSAFKLEASEMTRVADVMAATITTTNVDVRMLGDTMKYVAPAAQSVGASLEVANAMAGILGNIGIQGEAAGTAMRNMYNRMSKPPSEAKKALDALNIKTKDAQGNLRSMPAILADVARATKHMGNADKLGYLSDIAGLRAGGALKELAEMASSGKLEELEKILINSKGYARKTAQAMGDNLDGDITRLQSAWTEFSLTLSEGPTSAFREIAQGLTSLVGSMTRFAKEHPVFTKWVIYIAVGLSALLTVLGTLTMAFSSIVMPLMMVKFAMASFAVTTNLALWPVLAMIAAIAAVAGAAYLIYRNWDGIVDGIVAYFKNLFSQILQVFNSFGGGIAGLLAAIIYVPLSSIYNLLSTLLGWLGVDLPDSFYEAGANLINGLIGGMIDFIPKAKETIVNLGKNVAGWFKGVLGINSPSRVFAGFGGNISQGIGIGINKEEQAAIAPLTALGKKLPKAIEATALSMSLGVGAANIAASPIIAPSLQPVNSYSSNSQKASVQMGDIHIQINGAGENAHDIAAQVRLEIEKIMHEQQVRANSAFYDN